jgi:hypothetical protein
MLSKAQLNQITQAARARARAPRAPANFIGPLPRGVRRAPARVTRSQTISAPVATTRVERGAGPTGVDSITITRREYLFDVAGSTTYSVASLADNPGLPASYPWLSSIASSYEQHETVSKTFCFETEAPTSATGVVVLSYDYDVLDAAPVDKTAALLVKDSVRTAPWQSSRLTLKGQDLKRRGKLYVRSGTVANSDQKTYDLGRLSVSTVGQATTAIIGELWVEYVYRLHIAQQGSPPGVQVVGAGSVSKTSIFGSAPTYSGSSPVTASGSVLTFSQPGYYQVGMNLTGTGLSTIATPVGSTGTTVAISFTPIGNAASTQSLGTFSFRALANSTLTFDLSAATTVTATYANISPWFSTSV